MKVPTEQQVRAMTPDGRMNLLLNARRIGGEAGEATIALLDRLNLSYSSGGLSEDNPLYQEMYGIIMSPEGKTVAIKAVSAGLPAMAGIDPLLQERMGTRYSNEQQMTMNAGYVTGSLMLSLGYEKDKEGVRLPSGCIAKSSTTWKPKGHLR